MAINDKDEKLQHDINRAAAKISALSSGKKSIFRVKKYGSHNSIGW